MGFTPSHVGVARPLLVTAALALAGCGGGGGDAGTSSADTEGAAQSAHAVTIKDYVYRPARITVAPGTTVKFSNEDTTAHTATSKQSGVFDSDAIQPGKSGSVILEKTGTFAYYCVFHPFMKGTIVVK